MKKTIIVLFFAGIATLGFAQQKIQPNWQDFTKVVNAETGQNKISVIYVYNSPCDLCTTTEETILADTTVVGMLKRNFIVTKFDARTKEDVVVKDQTYRYSGTEEHGTNIYAIMLLDGVMGFPTFVFMNKEGEKIGKHFPVKDTAEFLQILKYYSSGDYENAPYEDWLKRQ
jgi:thioredoxin-related protein